jgi:hypothetical protein
MACHTTDITTEAALRLFADEDRRSIIAALVDHEENVVSLQDLTHQVATEPSPGGAASVQNGSRVALKHNHLPRLDDTGVIEYDWRSDTVRYHPNERVERLLEFLRTEPE